MKKSLKDKLQHLDDIFSKPKSTNEEAWDLVHDFYHTILTHMEKNSITEAGLANNLNISRSAVSQMFNKTQNISVKKMVEIAKAIGLKLTFNTKDASFKLKDQNLTKVVLVAEKQIRHYTRPMVVTVKVDTQYSQKQILPGFENFGKVNINTESIPNG